MCDVNSLMSNIRMAISFLKYDKNMVQPWVDEFVEGVKGGAGGEA